MFSFLRSSSVKSAASSHPSNHISTKSQILPTSSPLPQSTDSWQKNQEDENGYDNVDLENGKPKLVSRPSFSTPSSSNGAFLGNTEATAVYPPVYTGDALRSNGGYPSLRSTFTKLHSFLSDNSPSLLDSLSPGLLPTSVALATLIDTIYPYKLPKAILETYSIHDGQDPFAFGAETQGLFFGLYWMTIDQVESEYKIWRKFERAGGSNGMADHFSTPSNDHGTSRPHPYSIDEEAEEGGGIGMEGMKSFPPGWVRRKYSHPGWLPLITDRAGNYIGIDLDPPPPPFRGGSLSNSTSSDTTARQSAITFGQAGQVIAFGRDIDEKTVLFPGDSDGGWGRYLAAFVEDLERGQFARLGDGIRNGNSGSDEELSWEEGDGLGDLGYLEGARYGDEASGDGVAGEEGERRVWTLRSEYRRWLASNETDGGMVATIAERSKRSWKALGVGTISPNTSPRSHTSSTTPQLNGGRFPLSVEVPARDSIEDGPTSSGTERPLTPNLMALESPSLSKFDSPSKSQDYNPLEYPTPTTRSASSSVSLVLSPPSPTQSKFEPLPFSIDSPSSRRAQPQSPDHLNDGRHSPRSRKVAPTTKPKRRPPPMVCSIDLPTMSDLNVNDSEDDTPIEPLPRSPIRISTSPRNQKNLLPISSPRDNDSKTMLVNSGDIGLDRNFNGESRDDVNILIPAENDIENKGLGISSPTEAEFIGGPLVRQGAVVGNRDLPYL